MNILGGEACIWSELTNLDNFDQKVWMRAAVLNEKLWNPSIDEQENLLNIASRLIKHVKRLQ